MGALSNLMLCDLVEERNSKVLGGKRPINLAGHKDSKSPSPLL